MAACRLCLLYWGPNDIGLVLRLVWIAPLARHALRPTRTGALAQGATPRSILVRFTHPPSVVASRASHQHGLPHPPEKNPCIVSRNERLLFIDHCGCTFD